MHSNFFKKYICEALNNATPTEQIVFRNWRNFQTDQYCNELESNLNQLFAGFPFIDASNVNDIFSKFMEMLI